VVTFDGSSSSDPDGETLTYRWSTGYQPRPDTDLVYYPVEGSFALSLIVTNTHGVSDTATLGINVTNAPPVVFNVVTPAGAVLVGTSTQIRFEVGDPSANDTVTAVQVDWKDGSTSTPTLTRHSYDARFDATAAHTYSSPGNYPVEIAARDNDSGVTKVVVDHALSVVGPHQNHAPVAHITGPASGKEGALLEFSTAGSTDPDGDSLTVTCQSKGAKSQPTYARAKSCWLTFPDNGTYLVSLIVADPSGAADTASMEVTIDNVPPVIESFWVPAQQAVGTPASVHVKFDDPGTVDRYTITVNWGDGTSRSVGADSAPRGRVCDVYRCVAGDTLFHVYGQSGTYTPTVTVSDDDGGMNSTSSSNAVLVFNADERQMVAGYDVFDLGTLGGNSARPSDLNDRGQVVGTSSVASGANHAFLWDESGMHDLGTLGHAGSDAARINEAGTIAGTVWTEARQSWDGAAERAADLFGSRIGAIWKNGLGMVLDSTQAMPPVFVRAMNGVGDVAWTHVDRTDGPFGWLWQNGNWQRLYHDWWTSYPTAMNDRGDVVGESGGHAVLWTDGSMRDLGGLAPSYSAAMDINEGRQVVGSSKDNAGVYHFVLWEGDTIHDLGPAPVRDYQPPPSVVINERGQIAGSADGTAYFWSDGNKTTLPSLAGAIEVVGLNDNGDVVGTVLMGVAQHVFVWSQARGMIDLGTGHHGFGAAWVTAINARGDILGYSAPCVEYWFYTARCGEPPEVRAILWRNTQPSASR
jgi:probable HAF family extracellular repeat protein